MWRLALLVAACNHDGLPPGGGTRDLSAAGQCLPSATTVSGSIPHGFFVASSAWVWWETAECDDRPHLLLRLDDQPSRDGTYLDVTFAQTPQIGRNGITVSLGTESAPGVASLTRAESRTSSEEIRLEGTLQVMENSFGLQGTFSARHCPPLDLFCV